jgi:hypothetical protein
MIDPWNPQIQTVIQAICHTSLEQLQILVSKLIPGNLIPLVEFKQASSPSARADVFKTCLIVFILSENTIIPRKLQLQAATIISGTGSRKTLAIAIAHILQPDRVSFVVSLLKRLQITQAHFIL